MPVNPLELIARVRQLPMESLIDALRKMHADGSGSPAALWTLLQGEPAAVSEVRPSDSSAPRSPGPPTAQASGTPPPSPYETARRHFVQHAEKLREQAILAEKLLAGLVESRDEPSSPLRQEMRMHAAAGTTSCGRFILVNRLERSAQTLVRLHRIHGLPDARSSWLEVAFEPSLCSLEPGEEREVTVSVCVPDADDLPDLVRLDVDVLDGNQLLYKLWVSVDLQGKPRR